MQCVYRLARAHVSVCECMCTRRGEGETSAHALWQRGQDEERHVPDECVHEKKVSRASGCRPAFFLSFAFFAACSRRVFFARVRCWGTVRFVSRRFREDEIERFAVFLLAKFVFVVGRIACTFVNVASCGNFICDGEN
ncbi:hypothetical protein TSAR_012366 [Trichomalopsis sarcophagae]|uniref:Uncharacterized protein n=1 Tax=Trichomalopsis sarcophagae TaxID=543379 RepID=A0A232EM65_9HYME|nr:hypothetical protein TSAR_012366 [Trichomalopsis sarcophagae]